MFLIYDFDFPLPRGRVYSQGELTRISGVFVCCVCGDLSQRLSLQTSRKVMNQNGPAEGNNAENGQHRPPKSKESVTIVLRHNPVSIRESSELSLAHRFPA